MEPCIRGADWRRISLAFCWLALDNDPLNVMSCFKLSQRQAALSFFNRRLVSRSMKLEFENIEIDGICSEHCKSFLTSNRPEQARDKNPFCAQFCFARFSPENLVLFIRNFTRKTIDSSWKIMLERCFFLILFFFKSKSWRNIFRNYTNKQIHVFLYIRFFFFSSLRLERAIQQHHL